MPQIASERIKDTIATLKYEPGMLLLNTRMSMPYGQQFMCRGVAYEV